MARVAGHITVLPLCNNSSSDTMYIHIFIGELHKMHMYGKILWWQRAPKVYQQYMSYARCHIMTTYTGVIEIRSAKTLCLIYLLLKL